MTLHVKPEWIPIAGKEQRFLHEKLYEAYGTEIYLEQIWNRGDDLYFGFHTVFRPDDDRGEFLHNQRFLGNGTVSTSGGFRELLPFDASGKPIDPSQGGSGPMADFSFKVSTEQINRLRDGIDVSYTGMKLYEYWRSDS